MAWAAALGVATNLGTSYLQYRLNRQSGISEPIQAGAVIPGAGKLPAIRAAGGAIARGIGKYGGAAATAISTGAILYDAFGRPVGRKRKRRARGITAHELKSFKRVTRFLGKYCPTVRRYKNVASRKCK